jgi:glycosyltransferase involved in cell wall biosynthesis
VRSSAESTIAWASEEVTVWQGHSVSVVLPTYRERDSIRGIVLDFFNTGVVDEVIVVNNNAEPGTSDAIADTDAREVHEPMQGYGYAIRRGLKEANADYIAVCEPDATFVARDIFKLLAYADNFDIVYGSRTSPQLVWTGANMGWFLRWGNWFVAKYLEFLFNATNLTDVGCTMRLTTREAALALGPLFRIGGSEFGPEMMIRSLRAGFRVVQIPVNYRPRVGSSSVTGDPVKAVRLGLRMIALITKSRFERVATVPVARSESASSSRSPQ